MIISRKYVYIAVFLLVLIGTVWLFTAKIMFGYAEITLEGPTNPLTTTVRLDGKLLVPSGEGGKTYTARVRPGSYKLVISGPLVERTESNLQIGLQQTQNVIINLNPRTKEQATTEALDSSDNLTSVAVFGNNTWLVAAQEVERDKILHVIRFDSNEGRWGVIISGDKLDSQDPRLRDAPVNLVKYLIDQGAY